MRRVEAHVHAIEREEAPHHEARARKEHERQHDFSDDQRAGPAPGAQAAGAAAAAAFLHHLVDVGLGHVKRWREAEDERGRDAHPRKEDDDDGIDRELHPVRLALVGQHRVEDPDAAQGQAQPEHAADARQQDAFDQQLTHDPPAARAERHADRNLARPLCRPREQQVGDVGAGDQQHEADRAHQRPEDQRNLRAGDAVVVENEIGLDVLVGVGKIVRELVFDDLQLGARLRQRHTGFQPPHHLELADGALGIAQLRRQRRHRNPEIGIERELHVRRHHPDHRGHQTVDLDTAADHLRIAAVAVLPNPVPEHHGRLRARAIVSRTEVAADHRTLADHLKRVGGDVGAAELLGRLAFVRHVDARAHEHRQAGVGPGGLTNVDEVEA